jgi:hypothetical protein
MEEIIINNNTIISLLLEEEEEEDEMYNNRLEINKRKSIDSFFTIKNTISIYNTKISSSLGKNFDIILFGIIILYCVK